MSPKYVGIGCIGIVAILGVSYWMLKGQDESRKAPSEPPVGNVVKNGTTVRPPVKTNVVNRLPEVGCPKLIKTKLIMTGRAQKADWGFEGMGSFILTFCVDCKAEIRSRDVTSRGEIKVVEKRTFSRARQGLKVSEADVKLDLYNTLPLADSFSILEKLGEGLSAVVPAARGPAVAVTGVDMFLQKIDGTSVRGLLKTFGVSVPVRLEEAVNRFLSAKLVSVMPVKPSDVEGRSYLITYYQDPVTGDKVAPPMRVDVRHADDNSQLTDDEWALLRRVNAFIDSDVIDTDTMKVGETKYVDARDCECLFDPYVEGSYSGGLTVERMADNKKGDWVLEVRPGNVSIVSDEGRTTGEVTVKEGKAAVDAGKLLIREMDIRGEAAANQLNPHHLLFKARMGGKCDFTCKMTVEDAK